MIDIEDCKNFCPRLNTNLNPELCRTAKIVLCGINIVCCLDCGYIKDCDFVCRCTEEVRKST